MVGVLTISWAILGLFTTNFCVETETLYWSCLVPLSYILIGKKWQNLPIYHKNGLKKWFCRKIWAEIAKWGFIWISVSPKDMETVEISHSTDIFFLFSKCYQPICGIPKAYNFSKQVNFRFFDISNFLTTKFFGQKLD